MKKMINNAMIVILSLLVFTILPTAVFATDMWAETPNLNDDSEVASTVTEPVTFKYDTPAVDMWAKTPDLNAENQAHDVNLDDNARIVNDFRPEMYAETPDLNKASAERQVKIFEDTVIAKK
jgi:hypothetical protein